MLCGLGEGRQGYVIELATKHIIGLAVKYVVEHATSIQLGLQFYFEG